jgi:hypothetical protein
MMSNPFNLYEIESAKAKRRLRQATRNIQSAVCDFEAGRITAEEAGRRIGRTCMRYEDVGSLDTVPREEIARYMKERGIRNKDVEDVMTEVLDVLIS